MPSCPSFPPSLIPIFHFAYMTEAVCLGCWGRQVAIVGIHYPEWSSRDWSKTCVFYSYLCLPNILRWFFFILELWHKITHVKNSVYRDTGLRRWGWFPTGWLIFFASYIQLSIHLLIGYLLIAFCRPDYDLGSEGMAVWLCMEYFHILIVSCGEGTWWNVIYFA